MDEKTETDLIIELAEKHFGPRQTTLLGQAYPPFDISRPNIHDSKKEFLREKAAVQAMSDHLKGFTDEILEPNDGNDPEHSEMITRIRFAVEKNAVQNAKGKPTDSASELVLTNLVETGFFYNSIYVVIDMITAYNQRFRELCDQEKEFWSLSHRAPNYYARTIALRFARYFAHERRARPTFGTSSDGPHPSTEYGRLLEEVFSILGIRANIKNAAEWAIGQLTEHDWNPPPSAMLGDLLGPVVGSRPRPAKTNALAAYAIERKNKGSNK